jgi:hypothetical protein
VNRSCLVDTNVLVWFFTGQPPAMAKRARAMVAQADAGKWFWNGYGGGIGTPGVDDWC